MPTFISAHIYVYMLRGFMRKFYEVHNYVFYYRVHAVAAVKGIEGIVWAGGRGLMSKLVKPEQQGKLLLCTYLYVSIITLMFFQVLCFPFSHHWKHWLFSWPVFSGHSFIPSLSSTT